MDRGWGKGNTVVVKWYQDSDMGVDCTANEIETLTNMTLQHGLENKLHGNLQ